MVLESADFPLRRSSLFDNIICDNAFLPTPTKYACQAPKFGCHVTSLCQGLRHSAGSGGEDPENQVVFIHIFIHRSLHCANLLQISTFQTFAPVTRLVVAEFARNVHKMGTKCAKSATTTLAMGAN